MKVACVIGLLGLVGSVNACLNDRDTLETESNRLRWATEGDRRESVWAAITGRFDQFPPAYFRRRIDLARAKLKDDPSNFDLYDDIAVAFERQDQSDEALEWMALKASAMKGRGSNEDRYRLFANRGTFKIHRALRTTDSALKAQDLKSGIADLRSALGIKPDAHFGREAVQVELAEWIAAGKPDGLDGAFTRVLNTNVDPVRGLTGLIVMGSAWNSKEVFALLEMTLLLLDRPATSYAAGLRAREISGEVVVRSAPSDMDSRLIEEEFKRFRQEADQWRETRNSYILEQLKIGRHPDSDSDFWGGLPEQKPPQFRKKPLAFGMLMIYFGAGLFAMVTLVATALLLRNRRLMR
jgi:hypothetical protein